MRDSAKNKQTIGVAWGVFFLVVIVPGGRSADRRRSVGRSGPLFENKDLVCCRDGLFLIKAKLVNNFGRGC